MTNDGLHVNDEGYKIWRDAVAPYIAPEMTFGDELYPIGNNDIMILGNNLVGGAEWHELLDNPCVKSRNTWPDVVNSLPALAKQIAAKQPRAIVLQSSYNMPDSLPKGANLGADFDADIIVAKMQEAIDAIRQASPDTKILIQSLIPVNSTYEKYAAFNGTAKKVKAANKKLQKLAKKAKVTWIDVYPAMVQTHGSRLLCMGRNSQTLPQRINNPTPNNKRPYGSAVGALYFILCQVSGFAPYRLRCIYR